MVFQIFAKENCPTCRKAQDVLSRLGVPAQVRYVDGPRATPENVAALAWHDWVDKMPLVLVTEETGANGPAGQTEKVIQRWDGSSIADRWFTVVRDWVSTHEVPGSDSPPPASA